MCSFCQSVTLNLSGKKNLRGEAQGMPGVVGGGGARGETKEKKEKIVTA